MSTTFNIRQYSCDNWGTGAGGTDRCTFSCAPLVQQPTWIFGTCDQSNNTSSALPGPTTNYSTLPDLTNASTAYFGFGLDNALVYQVYIGVSQNLGYDINNWNSQGWTTGNNSTFLTQLCTWYAANLPLAFPVGINTYNLIVCQGVVPPGALTIPDVQIFPMCYPGTDPDAQQVIII